MYKARSVHAMRFATCNIEYKKRAVVPLYFYLYNVISVIIPILPLDLYITVYSCVVQLHAMLQYLHGPTYPCQPPETLNWLQITSCTHPQWMQKRESTI